MSAANGRSPVPGRKSTPEITTIPETRRSKFCRFCICCPCLCEPKQFHMREESRMVPSSSSRPPSSRPHPTRTTTTTGPTIPIPRYLSWCVINSCFFTTIRQGSLFSAFYTLIFYTMCVVAGSVHMDTVWANEKIRWFTIILVFLFLFTVFTSILLFIAIVTKNDSLMVPWLLATLCTTTIDFVITIYLLMDPNPSPFYFAMVVVDVGMTAANFLCLLCVFSYFVTIRLEKSHARNSLTQSVNMTSVTTIGQGNNRPVPRDGGPVDPAQVSIIEGEMVEKTNKSTSLITQESGLINYNNQQQQQRSPRVGCPRDIQSSSSITESGITSSPARQLNREKYEMEQLEKDENEKKGIEISSRV